MNEPLPTLLSLTKMDQGNQSLADLQNNTALSTQFVD